MKVLYNKQLSLHMSLHGYTMEEPQSPILFDTTNSSRRSDIWEVFGRKIPKAEIEYFGQIVIIYIVVIASIINLACNNQTELFMTLLGMCLGAVLPSPHLKKAKDTERVRQLPTVAL